MNKEIKKTVLFVTGRPHHILLSIMLATKFKLDQNFNVKNYLMMVGSFNKGNMYKDCLNFWGDNPFYKILVLPLKEYKYRVLRYIEERKYNKKIKRITKKIIPNIIYTFNDTAPHTQSALQIQQKLNCGKAIYIEDGTNSYCKMNKPHILNIKQYLKRYMYGSDYIYLPFHGSHPQITEMYVHYPELIDRKRYPHLKIKGIDKGLYNIFEKSKFLEKLLSYSDYDIYCKLKKLQYIIILPHPDSTKNNTRYFTLYEELFKKIIEKKYRFAIKYHPSDNSKKFTQIENKLIFEIPNYLPIEIIYIMLRNINKNIYIIGDDSTSIFITPGVLLPDAKVYSLVKMIGYKNEEIIEKFKDRVIMIKSLKEIEGL